MISTKLSIPVNRLLDSEQALENSEPPPNAATTLPIPNPTKSFWLDPSANPLLKQGSEGDLATTEADICIIGSGITGISVAYHLSKGVGAIGGGRLRMVILEARDFCSGATGRNGGHLTANAFLHFRQRVQDWGLEDAKRMLLLEGYTVSEVIKIVNEHHLRDLVDLVDGGHVSLLFTQKELEDAKLDFEFASKEGVDLSAIEWLDENRTFSKYGTSYPAFFEPGHNIWPSKLVTHIYYLAKKSPDIDLDLFTSAPVTKISKSSVSSYRWKIESPRGNINANYIIHATNAYASHLLPSLTGSKGIIPTRAQMITTRSSVTAEQLTRAGWGGNEGFEYWFPRPMDPNREDHHPLVVLGGGREASAPGYELYETDDGSVNPDVGSVLRKFLPEVFPGKFEIGKEPEMEWTGIMGFTKSGDPFVGPIGGEYEGQFIAAGYSGHGMPRSFACAQVVAEMIVASINGEQWVCPEWLPLHYLTSASKLMIRHVT